MKKQKPTLREKIDELILERLDEFGGNRTHAARSLGISDKSIRDNINRLREKGYKIEPGRGGKPN